MSERPRWRDWTAILVVFAAAVFGAAWLGRMGTYAANVGAALAITAGTVAVAALTWRFSKLPRWATVLSVCILGASAIAGASLWPASAGWNHAVKDTLWMHPWFFLTVAGVADPSHSCAGSRVYGWVFVGVSVFIGAVVPAIVTFF
jgi:hypothetical protein